MKTLLCQIHQKLIHLNRRNKLNREIFVVLSVTLGFVSHWLVFSTPYDYYTNYTIGFFRSIVLVLIFNYLAYITDSYRLCGLMMLSVISSALDLTSLMSTDLHVMVTPYRYASYGLTYNFENILSTYEVACVLFTIFFMLADFVKARFESNPHDNVSGYHSHHNKNNQSHTK